MVNPTLCNLKYLSDYFSMLKTIAVVSMIVCKLSTGEFIMFWVKFVDQLETVSNLSTN